MEYIAVISFGLIVLIYFRRHLITTKGIYIEKTWIRKMKINRSKVAYATLADEKNDEITVDAPPPSQNTASSPSNTAEVKVLYKKAMYFYERNELQEAEKRFIQVLALDDNFLDANNKLGLIYIKTNQFPKAVILFKKLVSLKDDEAIYHSNLGLALFNQEKYEESLSSYLKSIDLDASRAGRFISVAEVYKRLDNKEKATEMYNKAINAEPSNINYLLIFSLYLIEENKPAQAKTHLEKILDIKPNHQEAMQLLGSL